MVEPFKNLLNPALIEQTAWHLQRSWPAFAAERFIKQAGRGLQALEMKARAMQIADALEATLPADFARAAAIVEHALAPASHDEDLSLLRSGPDGLAGWIVWPLGEWVVRRGMAEPQRALALLRELTQRHSAEWALRPFILAHPELVFRTLDVWSRDPSPHVRRLVSEGSRPRLPWGLQLKPLVADPSPTLPLLAALQDDPSAYVRRSVANHLNDIARDHPERVADWLQQHLPGADAQRRALLRHATRTLVKKGHPRVLALWGVGAALEGQARLRLAPRRASVGAAVCLQVELRSTSTREQVLLIDYAVHHVRADGSTAAKVFKGWQLTLAAGASERRQKRHSLKPITTRRYQPGRHRVELLVNGRVAADDAFDLRL